MNLEPHTFFFAICFVKIFQPEVMQTHDPHDWHLVLDFSKRCLNYVVSSLHDPVIQHISQKSKDIKTILMLLGYDVHYWLICESLKIMIVLFGNMKDTQNIFFLVVLVMIRVDIRFRKKGQWGRA